MKEEEETQCAEDARIQLPWGGKIVKFCPVHANNLAIVAQVIGAPLRANAGIQCESLDPLSDEERGINKNFPLPV